MKWPLEVTKSSVLLLCYVLDVKKILLPIVKRELFSQETEQPLLFSDCKFHKKILTKQLFRVIKLEENGKGFHLIKWTSFTNNS